MVPQTKVFVGSLPPGSKPQDLRRLFERFGVVTECDIMNRCGFVHMQTEEMAMDAIKALDNSSFNGAVITVERGRIKDRNSRPGGGGRMGNGGGLGGRGGPMGRPPMRNGMGGGGGSNMRGDMGPRGMGGPRGSGLDSGSRGPPRGPGGPMRSSLGGGTISRSAPYMREDRRLGAYDRSMDRPPLGRDLIYPDDGRYAEDRRGFALVDDRRMTTSSAGYGEEYGMYQEDRSAAAPPMYDDMLIDRRGSSMSSRTPHLGYERAAPVPAMGNGGATMYTRRASPIHSVVSTGAYDRSDQVSYDRGDQSGYDRGDQSGYSQRYATGGRMTGELAPY